MDFSKISDAVYGSNSASSAASSGSSAAAPWLIGGSILGSLAGGIFGNKSSAKEAQKAREWQEMMANTAHQREVADLRAAGLNPILSATGGSGAATPSGAAATNQHDVISPAIASALSVFKTMADTMKTLAERETELFRPQLIQEQTSQTTSASGLNKSLAAKAAEETTKIEWENAVNEALWRNKDMEKLIRENYQLDIAIKRADKEMAVREAERMLQYKKMDKSEFGPLLLFIERLFGSVLKRR